MDLVRWTAHRRSMAHGPSPQLCTRTLQSSTYTSTVGPSSCPPAKRNGRDEEESGRDKNIISSLFSLLNRLQPVRGAMWHNFTEPKCLLAKCSKVGVRQQRTITFWMSNKQFSHKLEGASILTPKKIMLKAKKTINMVKISPYTYLHDKINL